MAVTRDDILAYLISDLSVLGDMVTPAITHDDTEEGWQYVLDDTFSRLGYNEATDSVTLDAMYQPITRALARYYGLLTISVRLTRFVDAQIDQPLSSRKDSQISKQVKDMLDRTAQICNAFGYPVDGKHPEIIVGEILLDYLRERPTTEFSYDLVLP
jgi:hypothetical protein